MNIIELILISVSTVTLIGIVFFAVWAIKENRRLEKMARDHREK